VVREVRDKGRAQVASKPDAAQERLLGRYMKAWEGLDLDNFVALLKEDATDTMPPLPQWYLGRGAVRTFFAFAFKTYDGFRMVPTAANGEPAFAAYARQGRQFAVDSALHPRADAEAENHSQTDSFLLARRPAPVRCLCAAARAAGVTKSEIDLGTGQQAAHQRASGA
jgi:hypothetical protein